MSSRFDNRLLPIKQDAAKRALACPDGEGLQSRCATLGKANAVASLFTPEIQAPRNKGFFFALRWPPRFAKLMGGVSLAGLFLVDA